MIARFYRGPWNGKKKVVKDDINNLVVDYFNSKGVWAIDQNDPAIESNTSRHVYYRTRHTHPDGSVFFEWSKPRGTRVA